MAWKVPLTYSSQDHEAQIFHRFRSSSSLQDITHFRIFPLTPMLEFESVTKFLAKKRNSLYFTIVAYVRIKFQWKRMKTVGVAFWNQQRYIIMWNCGRNVTTTRKLTNKQTNKRKTKNNNKKTPFTFKNWQFWNRKRKMSADMAER